MAVTLIDPTLAEVPSYIAALQAGFSPTTDIDTSAEELARWQGQSAQEEQLFQLDDRNGNKRPPVTLSTGVVTARLPSIRKWVWDGEFCGVVSLRWPPGMKSMPKWAQGNVGYVITQDKQNLGYATTALGLMLPIASDLGMTSVDICLIDQATASVVTSNGGVFLEESQDYFGNPEFWYRITLT